MLWDIFCKVIDNHGDIGVCWRLSVQLAARGHAVRLWVDDDSALAWMAPGGDAGVQVLPWDAQGQPPVPGDAVIEAFGCHLDERFQAAIARTTHQGRPPAWINLEYLTAESFATRSHGLASPVLAGPATGLVKRFFYPGFQGGTGGLLREPDLAIRMAAFDRGAWLRTQGIAVQDEQLVSLFCYEPQALGELLLHFAAAPRRTRLLVTQGRARAAVQVATARLDATRPGWNDPSALAIDFLPLLTQPEFDHLLWACDLNFVRGEDSLVRALWAGKPLVWHIYPQHDDAHRAKLAAFLDWLEAPASLREFHEAWNGMGAASLGAPGSGAWTECLLRARQRLLAQDDLVTQLQRFATGANPS
ncbi:MAG TPA: elongation factor P maturation arginine rhamnosyltransferase EarP [Ramlibacter sp.]|nr:elongation factor P maturation arginine rhamnosyltransferase EarP [Ramlibacter sp.]